MDAYYFYAAVFGFLSGVFLRSLAQVPITYALIIGLISCVCISGFAFVRKKSNSRPVVKFVLVASLFLLAASIGIWRTHTAPTELPSTFVPLLDKKNIFVGVVVAPPDLRESSDRLTVEIERGDGKTRIIASASLRDTYHVGDIVRVTGLLKEPEPFDSDGGRIFRYDQFLAKDGVFGLVSPAQVEVVGQSRSAWLAFLRFLERIKDAFIHAIGQSIAEPESALAVGIIAGGKQGLGTRLLDAFTVTGMLQIVVLSGYNVMIIAEGVLATLRALPKRTALSIAAIVIALFVLAAGAGTAAVRAGIMALISLFARGTNRTYDVLRALFAALILMLLAEPLLLVFDPGLQLSFMATLGLVLGSNLMEVWLVRIRNATFREMLATTLAAQAAVLPLLLYQSGNLSFVAIPANLLAAPVLPAAMAASAIAALCAFVLAPIHPVLPFISGIPAYLFLTYVTHVAEIGANVPYANIILPAFPAWWLVPAYVVLGWIVWKEKKKGAPALPAHLSLVAHPMV